MGWECGICVSDDGGASWSKPSNDLSSYRFNNNGPFSIAATEDVVLAGVRGTMGAVRSTDNGTTWVEVDSGLSNCLVLYFEVKGDTLFAGLFGDGVWKRPLAEISEEVAVHSPIKNRQVNQLNIMTIVQTSSKVNFSIPSSNSEVISLKIFSISGREMASFSAIGNNVSGIHVFYGIHAMFLPGVM